jgi:hypothetical protein
MVTHVIETVKPTCWVETGTHMGWTCMWLAERWPKLPIYTVERDDDFFRRASENLLAYPQVKICHNDSRSFLWDMAPLLQHQRPIIFLDAHWEPPPPLKEECYIVSRLPRFVLLLDDFHCYQPDHPGDTFYSRGPTQGDAYKNDLSYTASELVRMPLLHYRPNYAPEAGHNGVGMFVRGLDYGPPEKLMKRETWTEFLLARDETQRDHPEWILPMHPSAEWIADGR